MTFKVSNNPYPRLMQWKSVIPLRALMLFVALTLQNYGCKKSGTSDAAVPPVEASEKDPEQYGSPFRNVPNTEDIVMYEVNLRAFSGSGNLKGVQSRLDSIKDLGVNVVWLMPIHPGGELKGIGSPYAVKNYKEVGSEYGTLDDLRNLVKEAHDRNIAVIMDLVGNHTAWDNPWIQNKAWYTTDASGNIVSPNGWADVADLNFNNSLMRREMIKAMKYWILTANVDGYRCDYADGVPSDFWKEAIDTLKKIPDRKLVMFAEGTRKDHFSAGFNLTFGWDFFNAMKAVYNKNQSASTLSNVNTADYVNVPEQSHILRFISNHDDNAVDNAPFATFKGNKGSLGAFALTLYMGGVPLIYNGQEVGNPSKLEFFSRTPIDWKINPDITAEYKKLIAFRKESNAIKTGSIVHFTNHADIVAFKKTSGIEQVVVLVNVRDKKVNYTLDSSVANKMWTDGLTGSSVSLGTEIGLEPFSYLVLKNN